MHDPRKLVRVFVVDDEPNIASTLAAILNLNGFNATPFTQPLDAINAAAFSGPPDLLVSDVMMPILNGIELAIQLKATCPECKVLLISGHIATTSLLEAAVANGNAFEVLSKPVHPADLLKTIQTMLKSSSTAKTPNMWSIDETPPNGSYL